MNIKRIGLDLAKQVFQLHGVDSHEQPVLRKKLKREHMLPYFRDLPACLIGMEACSSAHYWARELQKLGHTVKLMAPKFADSDPGTKRSGMKTQLNLGCPRSRMKSSAQGGPVLGSHRMRISARIRSPVPLSRPRDQGL